jgi:phasin family protein
MPLADIETDSHDQWMFMSSFLDISRTYLQSAERISALNVALILDAVNDGVGVADTLASAASAAEIQEIATAMDVTMIDRALAYSIGMQEVTTETQTEVVSLIHKSFQIPALLGTNTMLTAEAG